MSVSKLRELVAPYITPTEIDIPVHELWWCAGILEGEGSFPAGKDPRISVVCQMTDEDTILKLNSFLQVSKIYGPFHHENKKTVWMCSVNTLADALGIELAIYNLMSARRKEQITNQISNWVNRKSESRSCRNKGVDFANTIRAEWLADTSRGSKTKLAEKHGVSTNTISRIIKEERWTA